MSTFQLEVPLRWLDLDAQGHVNNGKVVDLLQEARVDFTLAGPLAHLLGDGIVVVSHTVEYLGSILFSRRPLRVDLRVVEVRAAQFTIGYDVFDGDRLVVRARTVCCVYDFEVGRPTRLGTAERDYLRSIQEDTDDGLRDIGSWTIGHAAHVCPVRLRWSDLDSYGHVNNVRFYDFVGEARVKLMAELLDGESIRSSTAEPEHSWLVARQDLRYQSQIEFRTEPIVVRTAIARAGRTSVTLVQQIADPDDGTVFSTSTTVLVHGYADLRPAPLPDELRAAAERWPAVATG
ncbi:acyl-CoA thioesterase [Nigerium massiliense]|uniref:acyl-CoA thioesterase n=1 Tax=Nigerium massiliense TaxID=1522317 RepID=UPI0006933FFD|nr:thioesterase family protein [Nigerium massiliense]